VFHSLRHTFKAAARLVMGEEFHNRLTAHAPKSIGRTYGDYQQLRAKIDLIAFGIETA
jgi:integrase